MSGVGRGHAGDAGVSSGRVSVDNASSILGNIGGTGGLSGTRSIVTNSGSIAGVSGVIGGKWGNGGLRDLLRSRMSDVLDESAYPQRLDVSFFLTPDLRWRVLTGVDHNASRPREAIGHSDGFFYVAYCLGDTVAFF